MEELERKLVELDVKLERVAQAVEKIRKYIMWTAIVTLALFVLPLIGLLFAIPAYLRTLNAALNF